MAKRRTPDIQKVFAVNLKRLRIARGMSQETLAAKSGLSRDYIGRLERHVAENVTLDTVKAVAEPLGVTAFDILAPGFDVVKLPLGDRQ